jgi:hypothetical protein
MSQKKCLRPETFLSGVRIGIPPINKENNLEKGRRRPFFDVHIWNISRDLENH